MNAYDVKAYNNAGELIQRKDVALTKQEIQQKLSKQGLIPVEIIELGNKQFQGNSIAIPLSVLEEIFSNLAELMQNGIKLDKAIELTEKGINLTQAKLFLSDLRTEIRAGSSLYEVAGHYPKLFNRLYLSLIELGEASGQLPDVLTRISEDMQFRMSLKQKVQQALAYPSVIFMVCILAVTFIFYFVLPQLAPLFEQATSLPWYTVFLLNTADFMDDYGLFVIAFIIASPILGLMLVRYLLNTNELFQRNFYSVPGISHITRAVDRIRFSMSLQITLNSGVPLSQALKLSVSAVTIPKLRDSLTTASNKIKQGVKMCDALDGVKLFDDIQLGYIETGEETGNLAKSFQNITQRSQAQMDRYIATATTVLEPILILFMGGVVGGVVIGMIMSIMTVQDINVL